MFDFSTWLFILPSVALFGIINGLPLIIPWLMKPMEEDIEGDVVMLTTKPKASYYSKSYKSMTEKLEKE